MEDTESFIVVAAGRRWGKRCSELDPMEDTESILFKIE